MEKFYQTVEAKLIAFSTTIQKMNFIQSLMEGFIRISPVTLGYSLLSIITAFLDMFKISEKYGLTSHFKALSIATTGLLVIYAVFSISTAYAKRIKTHAMNASLVTIASFMILMPFTTEVANTLTGGTSISYGINTDYLGAKGLLLGMVLSFLIPQFYRLLSKSRLNFKLPETVPPFIQESLSPMLFVGIIFISMLVIRILFSYTPFGNIFDFFDQIMTEPIRGAAGSPLILILILTFLNLLWFFGIHGAVLQGPMQIVWMTMIISNIAAFSQGQPMPYLETAIVSGNVLTSGGMFGLLLLMFTSKSKGYKAITKIATVPAIFNITEPIMFGLPIILNPIYFIPTVFAPAIVGFVTWFLWRNVFGQYLINPSMALLPFVLPKPISSFLTAGILGFTMWVINTALTALIWYPFFKIGDRNEVAKELALEEGKES